VAWSASQLAIGGAVPLKHMTITDDVQYGLRAKIRKTGGITFHVSYTLPSEDDEDGNSRPFLLAGRHPSTTLADSVYAAIPRGPIVGSSGSAEAVA
jgi:hypothetical protein